MFDLVIDDVPLLVSCVDAQPDWLLLAGSRARGRNAWEEPHECNARIYSRDGKFVRALALGDDIRGIQITEDGVLWVAYGVESESRVVPSDLVASDARGVPRYQYVSPERDFETSDIDALNAAGSSDIWVTSSPGDYGLLRVGGSSGSRTPDPLGTAADWMTAPWAGALDASRAMPKSVWDVPVVDAAGFAVSAHYVLLSFRDSPKDEGWRNELRLYALQAHGQFEAIRQLMLVAADGSPIQVRACVGRGSALYLRSETAIYRVDIATALAACRGLA